jgi:hypothetical protein
MLCKGCIPYCFKRVGGKGLDVRACNSIISSLNNEGVSSLHCTNVTYYLIMLRGNIKLGF